MKLKHQSDRTIESLKVFPYVAWGITIAFTAFVYTIVLELKQTADQLALQSAYLEAQTKQVDSLDLEQY